MMIKVMKPDYFFFRRSSLFNFTFNPIAPQPSQLAYVFGLCMIFSSFFCLFYNIVHDITGFLVETKKAWMFFLSMGSGFLSANFFISYIGRNKEVIIDNELVIEDKVDINDFFIHY